MLVVGGIGSLSGAVIGVLAVTFVIEFLRTLEHGFSIDGVKFLLPSGSQEIGLGVVMALILILRPDRSHRRPGNRRTARELAQHRNRPRMAFPSKGSIFRMRFTLISRAGRPSERDWVLLRACLNVGHIG